MYFSIYYTTYKLNKQGLKEPNLSLICYNLYMADEITPKEEVVVEAPIEPFNNESQDILPVSEPIQSPEPSTAQIPVSEPLAIPTESQSEIGSELVVETIQVEPEIKPEPIIETIPETVKEEIKVVGSEISESMKTESKQVEQIPEIKSEPIFEQEVKVESKIQEVKPKPVEKTSEVKIEQKVQEVKPELVSESKSISETKSESKQETKSDPNPEPEQPKIIPVIIPSKNFARELLVKARNMIQFRKRKKLDKVMTLFLKKQKITNDEVEKFMHISDATATRYLSQLEKENKIKQSGKTGKHVFYSKI